MIALSALPDVDAVLPKSEVESRRFEIGRTEYQCNQSVGLQSPDQLDQPCGGISSLHQYEVYPVYGKHKTRILEDGAPSVLSG